jgi:hypothetical protein
MQQALAGLPPGVNHHYNHKHDTYGHAQCHADCASFMSVMQSVRHSFTNTNNLLIKRTFRKHPLVPSLPAPHTTTPSS